MLKITNAYLTPNPYSRPQVKLRKILALVLHWVENPGTSANFNRSYFERRRYGKTGYGSAHYIVDLSGDILACIPIDEMAYHVGAAKYTTYALAKFGIYPNDCTLGIELCHLDWAGRFTTETLDAAGELCADLCEELDLEPEEAITTHNAITGKICPKYFIDNPDDLDAFRSGVKQRLLRTLAQGEDGGSSA